VDSRRWECSHCRVEARHNTETAAHGTQGTPNPPANPGRFQSDIGARPTHLSFTTDTTRVAASSLCASIAGGRLGPSQGFHHATGHL
jgi:hypothetical protein